MSELEEAGQLLERAERAAMGGDLVSAEELLKDAATIQERELGPRHPDLASTLTNLAIVAERSGRAAQAETLYRRAAATASAALPSDHPMVIESGQNLTDFCRAHGLPVDVRAVGTPTVDVDRNGDLVASRLWPEAVKPPIAARPADAGITATASPPPSVAPRPDHRPPAPVASQAGPATATRDNVRSLAWLAAGTVLVVAVVLLLSRPWSSRETSTPVRAPEPTATQPTEAVPPPTTAPLARSAPIERPNTPKGTRPDRDRQVATPQPSAPGAITLAIAQVCRSFSTSGSSWRCDPVGSSVTPGPIVLYTRVKSPRDTAVVHRWYQGNTLRQSVRLGIQANATKGYRTYSRQTVSDGDWRVEVRSADGALLHEQQFAVR